ncbi:sugar nucleotide-binding protein [uncultured Mesonia sp.]|uniref:sugar nucleotide-binding protein n=1 Tax=uncultured Mesonia sp. TaxID=399731 RepID=UPI00374FBCE1
MLGASGFIGRTLYKELSPYFNVYGTYRTPLRIYNENQQYIHWNFHYDDLQDLLKQIQPKIIIHCLKGDFKALHENYQTLLFYLRKNEAKFIQFSTANVFDAFTNYPNYEYDKTFSTSIYGKFQIQIENALLRLPTYKYIIARVPMLYGLNSPRIQEIRNNYKNKEAIEVFPKVIINAASVNRLSLQIHFMINQHYGGVYHLGSKNLVHHEDLILEICEKLNLDNPLLRRIYNSNQDRFLALLTKNKLPQQFRYDLDKVITDSTNSIKF